MRLKKEKLIKELNEVGFLEIGTGNGKQISIFKEKDVYMIFKEKWDVKAEDWKLVCTLPIQESIEDVFNTLKNRFNLEVF